MYSDEEKLKLSKRVGITEDVYKILKKEKRRLLKEENRKVSMAKITCNLILKEYDKQSRKT